MKKARIRIRSMIREEKTFKEIAKNVGIDPDKDRGFRSRVQIIADRVMDEDQTLYSIKGLFPKEKSTNCT